MLPFNLVEQTVGSFIVEGELTFFNLNKKAVTSFDFLKSDEKIYIDLQRVSVADSAGLALIIEWIKYSQKHAIKLTFKNMPEQLITLAKLSGFDLNQYIFSDKRQKTS